MNHGCGFDSIPTIVLKNTCSSISVPLTIIFNKSLKSGVFPTIWKNSIIIPIYKSGKRCDIKNYRGISKLSSIPKLFEFIVSKYLYFNIKSQLSTNSMVLFASVLQQQIYYRLQLKFLMHLRPKTKLMLFLRTSPKLLTRHILTFF